MWRYGPIQAANSKIFTQKSRHFLIASILQQPMGRSSLCSEKVQSWDIVEDPKHNTSQIYKKVNAKFKIMILDTNRVKLGAVNTTTLSREEMKTQNKKRHNLNVICHLIRFNSLFSCFWIPFCSTLFNHPPMSSH